MSSKKKPCKCSEWPTAPSVVKRLGIFNINVLYRWKKLQLERSGPVASSLEARVQELESKLRRVERERDILKKVAPGKVRERGDCYELMT